MPLKAEKTVAEAFSDILSIIIIATCFILKIPQILNIVKVKNAQALSVLGLLMELTRYRTNSV